MNQTEFLSIAREKISSDPRTRLTKLAQAAIDDPACVVDIHAHIFDKKCLTVTYILLRLLKSKILESLGLEGVIPDGALMKKDESEVYDEIDSQNLNTPNAWQQLEEELAATEEIIEGVELFGFDLKEAFKILKKKSMLEVLDFYINEVSIPKLPEFSNRPFVHTVLMMDLEIGWDIKPDKKFADQIKEIKEISHIRPIIPYFAVDPRRADMADPNENLYELFLKAFTDSESPFFGVKCYPALGYFPSDIRLDPIFQICEEKNIPVLTHCGGGIISTNKKKIKVKNEGGEFDYTIPGNTRRERAWFLNDPAHWDSVVNKYNKLKLNLAHFGGDTSWEDLRNRGTNQRVEKIIDMMQNPNWNVYTDFSFNVVEKGLFDTFQNVLDTKPEIAAKTMFGTDYWVVLPAGKLLEMQKEFLNQMKDHQTTLLHSVALKYLLS